MEVSTMVNGTATRSKDKVSTSGMMVVFTKADGSTTTCMVRAPTLTPTAVSISECTRTTSDVATVSSTTLTVDASRVCGSMASNMVRAHSFSQAARPERANGNMAKEYAGLTSTLVRAT